MRLIPPKSVPRSSESARTGHRRLAPRVVSHQNPVMIENHPNPPNPEQSRPRGQEPEPPPRETLRIIRDDPKGAIQRLRARGAFIRNIVQTKATEGTARHDVVLWEMPNLVGSLLLPGPILWNANENGFLYHKPSATGRPARNSRNSPAPAGGGCLDSDHPVRKTLFKHGEPAL